MRLAISGVYVVSVHTYFDRGGLIPSFRLGAKRMELPLEKLLEEHPRFGGVCGPDFNERNNIVAHNDSPNRIKNGAGPIIKEIRLS
jgi:hypothetical protein